METRSQRACAMLKRLSFARKAVRSHRRVLGTEEMDAASLHCVILRWPRGEGEKWIKLETGQGSHLSV